MNLKSLFLTGMAGIALAVANSTNVQAANLVTNGSFETNGGPGQLGYNTSASGWTLVGSGSSGTLGWIGTPSDYHTGVNTQFGSNDFKLSTSTGAAVPASPDGGYFASFDGAASYQAGVTQLISGLQIGHQYTVSFDWAAAQQVNFTGATTEGLEVSLGSSTQSVPVYSLPEGAKFGGWSSVSFTYTATATSETLKFLAVGTPDGLPPITLLDGVSVLDASTVPEPSSLALTALGLLGLGALRLRRRNNTVTA